MAGSATRTKLVIGELKKLYDIADAWTDLRLPGQPKKSCHSPFREDRRASFSVFDDGHWWKDFATGESGDVGDFVTACHMKSPNIFEKI